MRITDWRYLAHNMPDKEELMSAEQPTPNAGDAVTASRTDPVQRLQRELATITAQPSTQTDKTAAPDLAAKLSDPRIVCAAIRNAGDVIIGARHFDRWMISAIESRGEYGEWRGAEQGFIDQHGRFYTREEAWKIADANGQIFRDRDWVTGSLHSEHLY